MKKKLITSVLLIALSLSFAACGDNEQSSGNTTSTQQEESEPDSKELNNGSENESSQEEIETEPEEQEPESGNENAHTVDGITISAETFSVEPYEDSNGKYTKRISVNFTIKNEADSAFGYVTTWEGRLSDGYKLETWADIMSMDLKQVPSGGEKTDTAYFLIDDSIDPNEIIISYNFMDYGEEYWEDFGKIMTGEMGQSEYMEKYGDYEVLEFTVTKE